MSSGMAQYEHHCKESNIGGWGAETNREIVSFRSCVRAQLYRSSEWISKMIPGPYPFRHEISSLFPWEIRCSLSLAINEVKGAM